MTIVQNGETRIGDDRTTESCACHLKIRAANKPLGVWVGLDILKYVIKRVGNHATQFYRAGESLHGPRLSTPCLSIGEYCPVESIHNTLDELVTRFLIKVFLLSVDVVDSIECETLWAVLIRVVDGHLGREA